MNEFFTKYVPLNSSVLDVGGADVNGSYRPIAESFGCHYRTLDFGNADFCVSGYDWSKVPNTWDVIISGQTLEHDGFFWKTLDNMRAHSGPGAIIIIIVPSRGKYHAHPVDCYRFYPDCDKVFAEILNADVLERVCNDNEYWRDLGMVFRRKPESPIPSNTHLYSALTGPSDLSQPASSSLPSSNACRHRYVRDAPPGFEEPPLSISATPETTSTPRQDRHGRRAKEP